MTDESLPPAGSGSTSIDDMGQYLQVYIDESEEEVEQLIAAILELETNPQHEESLHKSFRMLHSLKGSSAMLGFEVVGNFAHELEDRFERYRSRHSLLDRDTTTLILKCVDYFRKFLERLRAGDMSEGDPSPLLHELQVLEERGLATASPESASPAIASSTNPPLKSESRPKPPAMTVSGGLKIIVRFRSGLQLADLKARLIVSRLGSIGEIIDCDPRVDEVASFDELSLFSLTIVTDRNVDEVRKIANVDGVESVEIQAGDLTAVGLMAVAQGAASIKSPEPAPDTSPPTLSSQPDIQHSPVKPITPAQRSVPDRSEAEQVASDRSKSERPKPGRSRPTEEPDASDSKTQAAETLRVDIGRLDRLMNLTGELVIANARFAQIATKISPLFRRSAVFKRSQDLTERLRRRFDEIRTRLNASSEYSEMWSQVSQGLAEDLEGLERQTELWAEGHTQFADISDAVDQLTRVSKNLQRGVLSTRMVPVGPLFNRFKRVIRDLSIDRRKQVQLTINGEKTELDKRMIDSLGDPLLHLVRNSIDHGLEPPDVRRAAGKSETGNIFLEATHRANNVLITLRDDGAGINTEKIRARILERGLASDAQVREMSEAQAIDYIWHPGFSTADAISEISGRGVGMDIVRSAVTELSGTIDVASTPGAGTRFTIRLPLTLAIIHSLLMRYREGYISIPIEDVREIVSIPRDQLHAVHRLVTIDVRGDLIPLASMDGLFTWHGRTRQEESATARSSLNVVVLQSRGKTLGLSVDSLVGRADLVIKSLAENFQPVRGLSGASILGDGNVCLMLDTTALFELASSRSQSSAVR